MPAYGEYVLVERLLDVNKSALPRAVAEMLKRGNRNQSLFLRSCGINRSLHKGRQRHTGNTLNRPVGRTLHSVVGE